MFNWVINPRAYHDYTIMPRLRLSDREALDMAAFLLSLRRPGVKHDKRELVETPDYMPDPFGFDENGKPKLDDASKATRLSSVSLA